MSLLVYITVYASFVVFAAAVVYRIKDYLKKPLHVRWELYPVAHEGKRASYGGGYLEESEWWKKARKKSWLGELKVMVPEILFLKAVREHNRKLWYATFPFHMGIYLIIAFIGLVFVGAIGVIAGFTAKSPIYSAVIALTNLCGPAGFLLCAGGAVGLVYKRLTDPDLKEYSAPGHFFNLGLFFITMITALLNWLFVDPDFMKTRQIAVSVMTFDFLPFDSSLMLIQVLLTALLIAYIPLTHMSHFFMKYFLYHDIRWGDEPNINSPDTDQKIGVVLNYPVTWSAPHIAGHGKKTWAEVATFNPAADSKNEEKEEEE